MKKQITILLGVLFLCFGVHAQSNKIKIKVLDASNNSVSEAVILFDNVRQKKRTNSFGVFKSKLSSVPKEISAFHPITGLKKIKYNGEQDLIIVIKDENDSNKINLNAEEINSEYKNFNTIYECLRGGFPGLNIDSSNNITIRGFNTVNGSTTPLFIVNSLNVDQETFSKIIPYTIKSITVLKGPETSRYGIRGANGVIEVVTF